MVELDSEIYDVITHREAAGAGNVVPIQFVVRVEAALSVDCDVVVLLEDHLEMDGVAFSDVLYATIVN